MVRAGKRGFIPEKHSKIVEPPSVNPLNWIEHVNHFGEFSVSVLGGCCVFYCYEMISPISNYFFNRRVSVLALLLN